MLTEILGKSEFIFELILAETILAASFERKPHFPLRYTAGCIFSLIFSLSGILNIHSMWGSIPVVLFTFILSLCMMRFCYAEDFWKLMFAGVAAFITQSIISSLFFIGTTAFGINGSFYPELLLYIIIILIAIPVLYFTFRPKLRHEEGVSVDSRTLTLLVFAAGIIDTVFKFYMIDHGLGVEAGGIFIIWKSFSMLACIFILCVQFGILNRNTLTAQNAQLEQLVYMQQKQFENTRENIELINIKCHDLKHWLLKLNLSDQNDLQRETEMINNALTIYDSTIHTGNSVLDIILTEKKLRCEYNHINMTCIADGICLDTLSTGEICSLFGNIIDNAIEAVSQNQDETKRTISLTVRSVGNLLSIHEENYYTGHLSISENKIETTKQDKSSHGFGLKSIQMIVRNHHGDLSINAKNGIFNINILLPLEHIPK